MHTIGEAAQLLGIGRVTLEKWCKRLHITPERHPQDWRYRVLTDEQIQAIRDERAKMPGAQAPILGTNALRSPTDGLGYRDASPNVAPVSRQRPLQRGPSGVLPDGMMSKEDASRLHGVPTSTLRRWCREGRVETRQGTYAGEHGQYGIVDPLTRRGLSALYALAHQRPGFTPCPDCPHDETHDSGGQRDDETPEAVVIPPASEIASE